MNGERDMKIKEKINVNHAKLSAGLSAALRICTQVASSPDKADEIDLSDVEFVTPTFALPFLVFADGYVKDISMSNASSYLRSIHFESRGVDSGAMRPTEFAAFIECYSRKRFVPIVRFPAQKTRISDRDRILSAVENILVKQTGWKSNVTHGIKYMLSEMADNISEHSRSEYGYIFAQCYPTYGYADICLGDAGITVLGSYQLADNNEIQTDIEALKAANKGLSTKNLPESENRGYGLITSREMLVSGLGGQYLMLSGDAVYVDTPNGGGYIEIPGGIRFKGTVIALRLPYRNDKFSYLNYLE